jgi:enamine deaminase RidA (YjgF/YER057c/UK114 family)
LSLFRTIETAGGIHFVIGMIGRDPSGKVVEGGIAKQTEVTLQRIEAELKQKGRDRSAIVRLRFYVVDMRLWPLAREVAKEFFNGSIPPSTAVGVTGLVEPEVLIEIDAEAAA